jgi:hypothetical protein
MVDLNIKIEKKHGIFLDQEYILLRKKKELKNNELLDLLKYEHEIDQKKLELIIFRKTELQIIEYDKIFQVFLRL